MTEASGAVVITSREIYDELKGLRGDVQKLLSMVPDHKETLDDHEGRIRELERTSEPDLEERVRVLERARWWIAGVVAAASSGGTAALQQILSKGG